MDGRAAGADRCPYTPLRKDCFIVIIVVGLIVVVALVAFLVFNRRRTAP